MYYNYEDLSFLNRELAGIWPGWTAVKLLGRGSFGAVYEIHRNIRAETEKAAMKVLRVPESDAEIMQLRVQGMPGESTEQYYEHYVDSIQNEITIMQKLVGNSHLVSYEDYSISKRENGIGWDIFIRMELLTTLTELMQRDPLDEVTALRMVRDIALGLRDCHKNGIIHRDIKPQNIFVNGNWNFKLGDFGVSRAMPGSRDVLSFKGTPGYMAPEIYRMESTDARSDIYSLGIVLYQCLNDNRLPFITGMITPETIEAARLRRFAGEPVPDPLHGSKGLKNIALKALAADPRDRFQTAGEMYLALMNVYKTDYSASYRAEFGEEPVQRSEAGRAGDTFFPENAAGIAKYSGAPKNRATVKNDRPESLSILPIILFVLIVVLLGALVTAVGYLSKQPSEHGNEANSEFVIQANEETETDGAPEEEAGNAVIEKSELEVNDETDTSEEKEPVIPEEQGSIGISGVTVTSDAANSYSMPVGVYVARILEGGGAANSDLQEGDIITAFDGRSVSSMEDLQAILQYYKAGTEVTLTVQRQNEEGFYGELFIKVTLGTRASIE